MPCYVITYKTAGTPPEQVQADRCDTEAGGRWLVLRQAVLVAGQPREVVVRRVAGREVLSVTEAAETGCVDIVDDSSA